MAYFYSQKMTYCECMMARQIGWDVMNRLGELECVHFQNNTINYDNPFVKSLKRCDEGLSKINEIKTFIKSIKADFSLKQPKSYKEILSEFQFDIKSKNIHGRLFMNDIEDDIQNIHGYLLQQKKELDSLRKQLNENVMQSALLTTMAKSEDLQAVYRDRNSEERSIFEYKCAVINRQDQMQLIKGIFRISRGNAWVNVLQINVEGIKAIHKRQYEFLTNKLVCVIIYQRGDENYLSNKINRFLSCLESSSTNVPPEKWDYTLEKISLKIKEIENLEDLTIDAVERYLHKLYEPRGSSSISFLSYLEAYTTKQREIYFALACTTASQSFLHFNIYIPSKQLPLQIRPNENLPPLTMTPKQPPQSPPTKFDTPPMLEIPQVILNTYGIPTYKQFNPAIFYIVTFGFFIGVMFGDVGHMLMAIPMLIHFKANVWAWTIIFWMGYCGLIYNQFFGLNIGLFSSCYEIPESLVGDKPVEIHATSGCVYPFGIDSIWKVAENQMQFTNSLKMKIAVIIGVTHMMLGLLVRFLNGIKKRDWLDVFSTTLPQTLFMLCTFVYMDYLIFLKWTMDYSGKKSAEAPSIISTMIAVFAGFGADGDVVFWERERVFERFLLAVTILMIPVMLLAKPLVIYLRRKPESELPKSEGEEEFNELEEEKMEKAMESQESFAPQRAQEKPDEQENMKEIFVHSFIETIEYVLGSVSNTASYLRLWALSLAHGQLSEVIFELILLKFMTDGYTAIIGIFFAFPFFYLVTFGVLICMDSMECFLHSLRLHWVEFQSKFYKGTGYSFESYSFKKIVQDKEK